MKNIIKKIMIYIYIMRHVPFYLRFKKIGAYSSIDKRYIAIVGGKYIQIGSYCNIGANLRIEAISKYGTKMYNPSIKIGDNVYINQNFHCTCASSIVIGKGTSITANCGIFDIVHPYDNINMNPRENNIETEPINIGENCLIGMNSVILPGVTMGNHVIVGANCTVTKGVYPSNSVLVGSPAKIIKQFDKKNNRWIKL